MTGVAKHTALNLLKDIGCACAAYHDAHVRNLRVRRVQADEIWSFVYGKDKNLTLEQDVASRITTRIQLTTDGHRVYADAVEDAFGADIDYAMLLVKIYGASSENPESRYSPASCIGCRTGVLNGNPDPDHIRRAQQSFDADGNAPLHAAHECFRQETGEPRPHGCPVFHALQLLSRSPDTSRNTSDGSWANRSCLDTGRATCNSLARREESPCFQGRMEGE